MDINKLRDRLWKLHALLGSDNQGEREAARRAIVELLAKNKLTWNDLAGLIAEDEAPSPAPAADDDLEDKPAPPALDLIEGMLARHLHLSVRC